MDFRIGIPKKDKRFYKPYIRIVKFFSNQISLQLYINKMYSVNFLIGKKPKHLKRMFVEVSK